MLQAEQLHFSITSDFSLLSVDTDVESSYYIFHDAAIRIYY